VRPTETRFDLQYRGWRIGFAYNVAFLGMLSAILITTGEYWSVAGLLAMWAVFLAGGLVLLRAVSYVIIDGDRIHVRAYRTGANVEWAHFKEIEDRGNGELRLHYWLRRDDGGRTSYSIYYPFWPRDPKAVLTAIQDRASRFNQSAHLSATPA
jgi:hypothetical protein